jgi:hypothetical protein
MLDAPTTDWSLIRVARELGSTPGRAAFDRVIAIYLPALRWYLSAEMRLPSDEADDLLQQFVVDKMIERKLLEVARPDRGKFRGLLVTVLRRFVISQKRRRRPDPTTDDGDLTDVATTDSTAKFERRWAEDIFADAIARTRNFLCGNGKHGHWLMLQQRVINAAYDEPSTSFEEIARAAGFTELWRASNALTHAKRVLRREILLLIQAEPEDADAVNDLIEILRRGAGGDVPRRI